MKENGIYEQATLTNLQEVTDMPDEGPEDDAFENNEIKLHSLFSNNPVELGEFNGQSSSKKEISPRRTTSMPDSPDFRGNLLLKESKLFETAEKKSRQEDQSIQITNQLNAKSAEAVGKGKV